MPQNTLIIGSGDGLVPSGRWLVEYFISWKHLITLLAFQAEGYCRCLRLFVRKLYLVRTITRHIFELESPNWYPTCILGYSRLVLKLEPSSLIWPFWLRLLGNSACPCDNLQWISARISKFAPNIHLGILVTSIENGCHWPWPSRSFGHFDSRNDIQYLSCILI